MLCKWIKSFKTLQMLYCRGRSSFVVAIALYSTLSSSCHGRKPQTSSWNFDRDFRSFRDKYFRFWLTHYHTVISGIDQSAISIACEQRSTCSQTIDSAIDTWNSNVAKTGNQNRKYFVFYILPLECYLTATDIHISGFSGHAVTSGCQSTTSDTIIWRHCIWAPRVNRYISIFDAVSHWEFQIY